MSANTITFLILLFSFICHVLRKLNGWFYEPKLASSQPPLPRGNLGWPIFGNMPHFLYHFKHGDPQAFISSYINRFKRVGVYRTHLFGKPCILAVTPEACKLVLTNDHLFRTAWPHTTRTLMGYKSFAGPMSEEEHHRLRRLTAPFLNAPEALAQYVPRIEMLAKRSLNEWANKGELNLLTELRKLTFNVIAHICITRESGSSLYDEMEKEYPDINLGVRAMGINFPGTAYHTALKARRRLVALLQKVVDERRIECSLQGSNQSEHDMLDALIKVQDENGVRLSDEQIIDMLIMYLNAGHESTAHTAMWVLLFLSRNPNVFMKVKQEQQEIRRRKLISESEHLTIQDCRSMKYLAKVMNETFRITNISLFVVRQALSDIEFNGYTIPKGWSIQTWMRQVHLDPEVYPKPYNFDPDRWDKFVPRPGQFIPFGAGSRLCPGNELAKLEVSIFIHHTVLEYKIEAMNPKCKVIYLPHPRPKDGFQARVSKIKADLRDKAVLASV